MHRAADRADDAIPGAPAAQLPGAAGAGVVPDVRLTSLTFNPLDSLQQRNPRPPQAVIDAKAAELDLDKPIPLRYAHWVVRGGARRLRHDHHRSAGLRRAVAPHRGQPAPGGHRLGAGHGDRRRRRRVGRDPAVPAVRPRHHGAVAAGAEHADVRDREPADPGGAAGQLAARRADVRVHRRDVAGRRRRVRGTSSSTARSTWSCRRSRWRWARSPATAATSATRCSTCSARTSSAPRGPRD